MPSAAGHWNAALTPGDRSPITPRAIEVFDQSGFVTALDMEEHVHRIRTQLRNSRVSRVAARVEFGSDLVAVLLACRPLAVELVIAGTWLPPEVMDALRPDCWVLNTGQGQLDVLSANSHLGHGAEGTGVHAPGIVIFSSGSTGTPKASRWAWGSFDGASSTASRPERWGIGYGPATFAAVSSTCQALTRARAIEYLQPADLALTRHDEPFDVVAGTPSFWRMSAIAGRKKHAYYGLIRVATIGGESVDQALLKRVRSTFAPLRIKQIFGTTEFGTVMSIDDGLPGLPLARAGVRLPNGMAFEVRNEMLCISRSPGAPFLATGDMVKIASGRIQVTGRAGRVINVGGHKVDPAYVSQAINQHPKVAGSRAYPVSSSLVGSVVGVDVVPCRECDHQELCTEIKAYAKLHLAPPERPRRVRVTEELTLTPSGKLSFDE